MKIMRIVAAVAACAGLAVLLYGAKMFEAGPDGWQEMIAGLLAFGAGAVTLWATERKTIGKGGE